MRMSKQLVIFSLFILSICYGLTITAESSPCEDWDAYKDEKCFKIIDETHRTYDDAIKTCQLQEYGSSLVSIRSLEEQEFFSNLLFKTYNVVDPVWIGAKYSSNKFKWVDDSELSFMNWAEGSPSNTADKACVQMIPDGCSIGKWADRSCNKKNLIACQKMQNWSISYLQKSILNIGKELQDSLEDVRNHIKNIEHNPVPIGFIYVQLPSQSEPKTIWSTVEWKDVTSEYAGLFFRAEGGGSATFNQIQEENAPRLTSVHLQTKYDIGGGQSGTIIPGKWSPPIYSGSWVSGAIQHGISFMESDGEVRPRNQAMRIWKRNK